MRAFESYKFWQPKPKLPLLDQIHSSDLSWVILPGFRCGVPGVDNSITKPVWNLPLSQVSEKGIDLDFGPLLLFDRLLIDYQSYEYATSTDDDFLKPMKSSLEKLAREGVVVLADFESLLDGKKELILSAAEEKLKSRTRLMQWVEDIHYSYSGWQANLANYSRVLGNSYDENTMRTEYGTYLYAMRDGRFNRERYDALEKQLFSKRKRRKVSDWELLQDLVRPTALYTYKNIALFHSIGAPFLDIDFTSKLYSTIFDETLASANPRTVNVNKEVETASSLFKYALPNLCPQNVDQLLKLLDKKSIYAFRRFIRKAAQDDKDFKEIDELRALCRDALEINMRVGKTNRTISRACAVIGQIPLMSVPSAVSNELVDHFAEKSLQGDLAWVYSLIEVQNYS